MYTLSHFLPNDPQTKQNIRSLYDHLFLLLRLWVHQGTPTYTHTHGQGAKKMPSHVCFYLLSLPKLYLGTLFFPTSVPPPRCSFASSVRGGDNSQRIKIENNSYRYKDPLAGDKVEVSWEGRFRLESLDVFVGRSWWEATVVQKVDGYM